MLKRGDGGISRKMWWGWSKWHSHFFNEIFRRFDAIYIL